VGPGGEYPSALQSFHHPKIGYAHMPGYAPAYWDLPWTNS